MNEDILKWIYFALLDFNNGNIEKGKRSLLWAINEINKQEEKLKWQK